MLKEPIYTAINAAAIKVNLMRFPMAMNLSMDIAKRTGGNRSTTTSDIKEGRKVGGAMMRRGIEQSSIVF